MKKEITQSIRQARDYKLILEDNINKIFRSGLFNKVSMKDRLEFLKELAIAKTMLWEVAFKEFPDAKKALAVKITENFIEWEDYPNPPKGRINKKHENKTKKKSY